MLNYATSTEKFGKREHTKDVEAEATVKIIAVIPVSNEAIQLDDEGLWSRIRSLEIEEGFNFWEWWSASLEGARVSNTVE